MKQTVTSALTAAVSILLLIEATNNLRAQSGGNNNGNYARGNRDPAQFLERRMQRYREQLEIQSDEEWKVIQPLIENVLQAQSQVRIGGFGGGRRGGPPAGGQSDAATGGGRRTGRAPRPDTPSNPDLIALRTAVDAKAPPAEIKSRLARLRETLKEKEAALTKTQEQLRQVLTARQEAIAVMDGLLK